MVRDSRGETVKVLDRRDVAINTELSMSFTCSLRPGAYTFSVQATDRAGNEQANTASQTLTVLPSSSDDDDD